MPLQAALYYFYAGLSTALKRFKELNPARHLLTKPGSGVANVDLYLLPKDISAAAGIRTPDPPDFFHETTYTSTSIQC